MRLTKTVFLIFCVSFLFSIAAITQAEESIIVNHRVLSAVPVEDVSNVTLEMTITNTGSSNLSTVTLATTPGSHHIIDLSTQALSIGYLAVNETLTQTWDVLTPIPVGYDEMVELSFGIVFLEAEVVNEYDETIHFLIHSEALAE